jgi:hypothetical protein
MSSTDRNHDFVCCEQIENMILNVVNRGGNWEAVHRLTVNALNKCPLVLIGFALKSAELQAQLCKHIYIYIYIYKYRHGRIRVSGDEKAEQKPSCQRLSLGPAMMESLAVFCGCTPYCHGSCEPGVSVRRPSSSPAEVEVES